MKIKTTWLFAIVTCLLLAAHGFAAATSYQGPELISTNYPWIKKEQMPELIKQALSRKASRKISQVTGQPPMSDEYVKFQKAFLGVETPKTLADLLDKLDKNNDSYPKNLKFIAAQLLPIRAMRGITWRMYELLKKHTVTHSYSVTFVKDLATRLRIFFPENGKNTKHMDAAFAYATQPFISENGALVPRIKNAREFQKYLIGELYPMLDTAANRLAAMSLEGEAVAWDNVMVFGTESFVDDLDRYKLMSEAHRHAALYGIQQGMFFLAQASAYELEDLFEYITDLGMLYGIDGSAFFKVDGVSEFDRVKVAKKYKKLFERLPNGAYWMERAYAHLMESVYQLRLTWDEIKDRPANEFAFLNPGKISPWERIVESNLKTIEAMVQGPTEIKSAITQETVVVNLPAFFTKPPKNLKDLMSTNWENGKQMVFTDWKVKPSDKHGVEYRNYFWGRATSWNKDVYENYFPGLKNGEELATKLRIFSQAWSGTTVGTPFNQLWN